MRGGHHRVRGSEAVRGYRLGRELGRGGFGVVYEGLNERTGEAVAIKRLSVSDEGSLASIAGEIELLRRLNHPNIVRYIDSYRNGQYLDIVLELVENGSLQATVKRFGILSEGLTAMYVSQILRGCDYLHSQGVVHRDIKAANILTTKEGIVKLTDFGVAMSGFDEDRAAVGSPFWMAPEIIEMSGCSPASDIWSVGCTAIELLTGKPPYFDLPAMSALFHIVQDEAVPLPDNASPALRDFLSLCFRKSAPLRPSAAQLLEHPWITTNVVLASSAQDGDDLGAFQALLDGADGKTGTSASTVIGSVHDALTSSGEASGADRGGRRSRGHGRQRMSQVPLMASVKAAKAQQQAGNGMASKPPPIPTNGAAKISEAVPEDWDAEDDDFDNWDKTAEAAVTATIKLFRDEHGALIASRAAQLVKKPPTGGAEGQQAAVPPKKSLAEMADADSDDIATPPIKRNATAPLPPGAKKPLGDMADRDEDDIGFTAAGTGATKQKVAVKKPMPAADDEEEEDWSFAGKPAAQKTSKPPLAPVAPAARKPANKMRADEEDDAIAIALPADVLRQRLAGIAKRKNEATPAKQTEQSADAFAMFDSSDFKRDEKMEELRMRQKDLLTLSNTLAQISQTPAEAAPVADIPNITRKITSAFRNTPSLRAYFLKNHGMLPVIDLLHTHKEDPFVTLSLLAIVNDIVAKDGNKQSLLENLSLIGALPAALQYAYAAFPAPVRAQAAKFVHRLVSTSAVSRQIFTACGGVNIVVGLLNPSLKPRFHEGPAVHRLPSDALDAGLALLKDGYFFDDERAGEEEPLLPIPPVYAELIVENEMALIDTALEAFSAVFELQHNSAEISSAMSANEFRRLFVKAGMLASVSQALRSMFLYVCAQVTALLDTPEQLTAVFGFCHWNELNPDQLAAYQASPAFGVVLTPPLVVVASPRSSAMSVSQFSTVKINKDVKTPPSSGGDAADEDDDEGEWGTGFNTNLKITTTALASSSMKTLPAPVSTRRVRGPTSYSVTTLPTVKMATFPTFPAHVAHAFSCLTNLTDALVNFANGDAPIKVALASPAVAAALLRILRPAPYSLLHHPMYAPIVMRTLKAIRLISMDPQVVEVLDACGAINVLVPFLVRESGLTAEAGASGAISQLHSKDVQNFVLHALFNMCRISRTRQAQAAVFGIVPALQRVVLSSSPLKTLALPILCDIAHAGSKARNVLFENECLDTYVQLLDLDYWYMHVVNSIADWASSDPVRMQPLLLQKRNMEALIGVLPKSTVYLDAVLPGLTQLVDKCPQVAREFSKSETFMSDLASRLKLENHSPFTMKNLLSLLRVVLECAENVKAVSERWRIHSLVKQVALEAQQQGKVILGPITDVILKMCPPA